LKREPYKGESYQHPSKPLVPRGSRVPYRTSPMIIGDYGPTYRVFKKWYKKLCLLKILQLPPLSLLWWSQQLLTHHVSDHHCWRCVFLVITHVFYQTMVCSPVYLSFHCRMPGRSHWLYVPHWEFQSGHFLEFYLLC
jgi:hypothetical protein